MNRPLVLIILDGWGYAPPAKANAISLARKPNYDRLLREYPNTLIHTSGRFVGLPEGQMGNSEVGHLNIGAGRIVHMDITKIDLMVANKTLDQVPLFQEAMEPCILIFNICSRCWKWPSSKEWKTFLCTVLWMVATLLHIAGANLCSGCNRKCVSSA